MAASPTSEAVTQQRPHHHSISRTTSSASLQRTATGSNLAAPMGQNSRTKSATNMQQLYGSSGSNGKFTSTPGTRSLIQSQRASAASLQAAPSFVAPPRPAKRKPNQPNGIGDDQINYCDSDTTSDATATARSSASNMLHASHLQTSNNLSQSQNTTNPLTPEANGSGLTSTKRKHAKVVFEVEGDVDMAFRIVFHDIRAANPNTPYRVRFQRGEECSGKSQAVITDDEGYASVEYKTGFVIRLKKKTNLRYKSKGIRLFIQDVTTSLLVLDQTFDLAKAVEDRGRGAMIPVRKMSFLGADDQLSLTLTLMAVNTAELERKPDPEPELAFDESALRNDEREDEGLMNPDLLLRHAAAMAATSRKIEGQWYIEERFRLERLAIEEGEEEARKAIRQSEADIIFVTGEVMEREWISIACGDQVNAILREEEAAVEEGIHLPERVARWHLQERLIAPFLALYAAQERQRWAIESAMPRERNATVAEMTAVGRARLEAEEAAARTEYEAQWHHHFVTEEAAMLRRVNAIRQLLAKREAKRLAILAAIERRKECPFDRPTAASTHQRVDWTPPPPVTVTFQPKIDSKSEKITAATGAANSCHYTAPTASIERKYNAVVAAEEAARQEEAAKKAVKIKPIALNASDTPHFAQAIVFRKQRRGGGDAATSDNDSACTTASTSRQSSARRGESGGNGGRALTARQRGWNVSVPAPTLLDANSRIGTPRSSVTSARSRSPVQPGGESASCCVSSSPNHHAAHLRRSESEEAEISKRVEERCLRLYHQPTWSTAMKQASSASFVSGKAAAASLRRSEAAHSGGAGIRSVSTSTSSPYHAFVGSPSPQRHTNDCLLVRSVSPRVSAVSASPKPTRTTTAATVPANGHTTTFAAAAATTTSPRPSRVSGGHANKADTTAHSHPSHEDGSICAARPAVAPAFVPQRQQQRKAPHVIAARAGRR